MDYEKPWVFSLNQTPLWSYDADQARDRMASGFLYQLKQMLVTYGGWTVEYSREVNTNPPNAWSYTDRWISKEKVFRSSSNNNYCSNIVLKSPEGFIAGVDGSYIGDQSRIWLELGLSSSYSSIGPIILRKTMPLPNSNGEPIDNDTEIGLDPVHGRTFSLSVFSSTWFNFHFAVRSDGVFWAATADGTSLLMLTKTNGGLKNSSGKVHPWGCCLISHNQNTVLNSVSTFMNNGYRWSWPIDNSANWGTSTFFASLFDIFSINNPILPVDPYTGRDHWSGQIVASPIYAYNYQTAGGYCFLGQLSDIYLVHPNITRGAIDDAINTKWAVPPYTKNVGDKSTCICLPANGTLFDLKNFYSYS